MQGYKRILVALELAPATEQLVVDKACALAEEEGAQLYLIHAVEHMSGYGAAYGVASGIDVEEMLIEEAKTSMEKVATQLKVASDRQTVKVGVAKWLILDEAERLGIDLIVVGSHGRHGVRLLLGSTANAILHGAKCDVLAVRIRD